MLPPSPPATDFASYEEAPPAPPPTISATPPAGPSAPAPAADSFSALIQGLTGLVDSAKLLQAQDQQLTHERQLAVDEVASMRLLLAARDRDIAEKDERLRQKDVVMDRQLGDIRGLGLALAESDRARHRAESSLEGHATREASYIQQIDHLSREAASLKEATTAALAEASTAGEEKGYMEGFADGYLDLSQRIRGDHADWDFTAYTLETSPMMQPSPPAGGQDPPEADA